MAQESREEDAVGDASGGRDGVVQEVTGVLMNKKQLTVGPPTDASPLLTRLPHHISLQPPDMCTQTAALGFQSCFNRSNPLVAENPPALNCPLRSHRCCPGPLTSMAVGHKGD